MRIIFCILFSIFCCSKSAAELYNVFEENGKVGLKNEQGQIVIPAQYESLGWTEREFSLINGVTGYKSKGLWGLLNLNNHKVTAAQYTSVEPSGSVILAYKKNNASARVMAGCISVTGKELIPFHYDGMIISNSRAVVVIKSSNRFQYGLVDLENKSLIPVTYKHIRSLGTLRYAVQNFDDKIALFTEGGKQLTPFNIDHIDPYKKNYAIIYQENKQGLIDRDGIIRIQPAFKSIVIDDEGHVRALPMREWVLLDGKNQQSSALLADSVISVQKNIFKLVVANRSVLVDASFKPISNTYSRIGNFQNGEAIMCEKQKCGLLRSDGTVVMAPRFDTLITIGNHLMAGTRSDGKIQWMIYDREGKAIHEKYYDAIRVMNENHYVVSKKNYQGLLNESGQELLPCVYDSIAALVGDYARLRFHGQHGIIRVNQEWIVPPTTNKLSLIRPDRYIEREGTTNFLKSIAGELIYFTENKLVPAQDFLIEYLSTGGLWRISYDGQIIGRQLPPEVDVDYIFTETEGLRGIRRDGRYGFVDDRGRLRIANRYENIKPFSEGFAAIKIRGRWGFIDHAESIVIQPAYEDVDAFSGRHCVVKNNSLYGLINRSGNVVLPIRYQRIRRVTSGRYLLIHDGLVGLADTDGKILLNPKYHHIEDLDNGYIIVMRDHKFGVVNTQGISTIPLMYDGLLYDRESDRYFAAKHPEWTTLSGLH